MAVLGEKPMAIDIHDRCRLLLLLRRASWRYTTSCDLTGCQPTPGYQAACGIGCRSRLAAAKDSHQMLATLCQGA